MNKTMNFYWGNSQMSFLRYLTLYSFCKYNPDWEVVLRVYMHQEKRRWTSEEKSDKDFPEYPDFYSHVKKLPVKIKYLNEFVQDGIEDEHMADAHVKDLMNWRILSTTGGFVADMDILFFRPMSKLVGLEADTVINCFDKMPSPSYIPVTLMGSQGDNRFYGDILRTAVEMYDPEVYESCGASAMPYTSIDFIREDYPELSVTKMPDTSVYPLVTKYENGLELIHKENRLEELLEIKEAVGVHWYAGSPLGQMSNSEISPDSKSDSTLAHLVRRIYRA